MGLGLMFFVKVLACLFICVCNGAPPKGDKPRQQRVTFTPEEDQLIVEELSKMYDGTVSLHTISLWDKIAQTFNEKWKQGTPGFPKERNARSLLHRLNNVLILNLPESVVKVPTELLKKFEDHSKAERGSRHPYTEAENDFIFKELLKPSYKTLGGVSTTDALAAELTKKRKAGTPGFNFERQGRNIRTHLTELKKRDLIPKNVLEKFLKPEEIAFQILDVSSASTSSSTTTKPQAELQVANETQDDDDWITELLDDYQSDT